MHAMGRVKCLTKFEYGKLLHLRCFAGSYGNSLKQKTFKKRILTNFRPMFLCILPENRWEPVVF